jgi:uncharacterized membrane protein YkvA (DUF1232 family)
MSDQRELHPSGLTRSQFGCLSQCAEDGVVLQPKDFLQKAQEHLKNATSAADTNRLINIRLANAILNVIQTVVDQWDQLSVPHRYWLAGAILYFSSGNDDEPDFSSPIGFEDDTEVLNACLRFANLSHLCLKVENYDDV